MLQLEDPSWRLSNLYYIKDKQGKKILFQPNVIQRLINKQRTKRIMILKPRQIGCSTQEILRKFDKCIWKRNQTFCILAHERPALKKLFEIVKFAYNNMPENLKPPLDKGEGSLYEMRFPVQNSKVYVALESRGDTIQLLHVSEFAFIKDQKKVDATLQAVPIDGEVTLETTPHGMNFFYDAWLDKESTFTKLFFPWFLNPEYALDLPVGKYSEDEKALVENAIRYNVDITPQQIAFRRFKQSESKELFLQEYTETPTSCFLASGAAYFNLDIVKQRMDALGEPQASGETYNIYANANNFLHYVIGADTSEGIGGDNSAASVRCVETQEQVEAICGDWKPSDFAKILYDLGKKYQHGSGMFPLLGVERNNHGHAVLLELSPQHLNYSNVFYDKDSRAGWLSNMVSRPVTINTYKDFIEDYPNKFNDRETLVECLSFVNIKGKPQAVDGKHDDRIIADAICTMMLTKSTVHSSFQEMDDKKTTTAPGINETVW